MEDATRRRRRRAPRRSVNFRRVAMPEEAFTREKIQLHGSIHRSHVEHMDNPHLCREAIILYKPFGLFTWPCFFAAIILFLRVYHSLYHPLTIFNKLLIFPKRKASSCGTPASCTSHDKHIKSRFRRRKRCKLTPPAHSDYFANIKQKYFKSLAAWIPVFVEIFCSY